MSKLARNAPIFGPSILYRHRDSSTFHYRAEHGRIQCSDFLSPAYDARVSVPYVVVHLPLLIPIAALLGRSSPLLSPDTSSVRMSLKYHMPGSDQRQIHINIPGARAGYHTSEAWGDLYLPAFTTSPYTLSITFCLVSPIREY